jgi:hypothetical protein
MPPYIRGRIPVLCYTKDAPVSAYAGIPTPRTSTTGAERSARFVPIVRAGGGQASGEFRASSRGSIARPGREDLKASHGTFVKQTRRTWRTPQANRLGRLIDGALGEFVREMRVPISSRSSDRQSWRRRLCRRNDIRRVRPVCRPRICRQWDGTEPGKARGQTCSSHSAGTQLALVMIAVGPNVLMMRKFETNGARLV